MALREVLQFPDERLRRVSKPLEHVDDRIRELARDMCDVMYDEPGIGLAAPQLGEAIRLVGVDTEWMEEDAERNPLVLAKELATLDHLTDGRVELGLGVGWMREEFAALGIPWERRGARNDEYVAAMRASCLTASSSE